MTEEKLSTTFRIWIGAMEGFTLVEGKEEIEEKIMALEEQNAKLIRKFGRIPKNIVDAYNNSVVLEERIRQLEYLLYINEAVWDAAFHETDDEISKIKELPERWRSTEKSHDGVRCHAWKVCADELEKALK